MALYRDRPAQVRDVSEILALARELHAAEKAVGHLNVLGQLLAGAQTQPRLAPATAAGLSVWTGELEYVLALVLAGTPISEIIDTGGLAKAIAAGFVRPRRGRGLGRHRRCPRYLDQLAAVAGILDELGPILQRAVRSRLRRHHKRTEGASERAGLGANDLQLRGLP